MAEEMARKQIFNCRRSGDLSEGVHVFVPISTSEESLKRVQERLLEFVRRYPALYRPSCSMDLVDIEDRNNMKLRFSIDYKGNWQDGSKKSLSKTKFMFALKQILLDLNIRFELPIQEIMLLQKE
jgi:hypothetical protein